MTLITKNIPVTEKSLAQKILDEWAKVHLKEWNNEAKNWVEVEQIMKSFASFCAQKILEKEKFLKEIIQQRNELRDAHWKRD